MCSKDLLSTRLHNSMQWSHFTATTQINSYSSSWSEGWKRALRRHQDKNTLIIPIWMSECYVLSNASTGEVETWCVATTTVELHLHPSCLCWKANADTTQERAYSACPTGYTLATLCKNFSLIWKQQQNFTQNINTKCLRSWEQKVSTLNRVWVRLLESSET